MNECERYEELISALLDGELGAEEEADVRAHMATCAQCAKMYEAFAAVGAAVKDHDVPDALHETIMSKVRETQKAQRTHAKIIRFRSVFAAAACLVVLVGTVFALNNNLGKPKYSASGSAAKAAAPESMMIASGSTSGAAPQATEEAAAENEQVLMSVAINDAAAPEAPAEAAKESADTFNARADSGGSTTLYGADEVYPTVMVDGALYEWHRGSAIRLEGLPEGCLFYDDVTHTEEITPKQNGEFASLFPVEGEIYTVPGDEDVVYLQITTDWMEDTVVQFDRVS